MCSLPNISAGKRPAARSSICRSSLRFCPTTASILPRPRLAQHPVELDAQIDERLSHQLARGGVDPPRQRRRARAQLVRGRRDRRGPWPPRPARIADAAGLLHVDHALELAGERGAPRSSVASAFFASSLPPASLRARATLGAERVDPLEQERHVERCRRSPPALWCCATRSPSRCQSASTWSTSAASCARPRAIACSR